MESGEKVAVGAVNLLDRRAHHPRELKEPHAGGD